MMVNISRRIFLSELLFTSAAAIATNGYAMNSSDIDTYQDAAAMDLWMQKWMNALPAASGALHLGRFADRRYWLLKEIRWIPNTGQNASPVTVPIGFVTDFASIPRVFWSVLPPDGQYTYAAIIHDYLYWQQGVSIDEANKVLRYAMDDFRVDAASSNAISIGVAAGGAGAWKENAALKANGHRRIIKKFPDDPTTTWSDWQKLPDVYL